MTHCIIMTAYKDADNINSFINATPTDWGIYIHLDKKSCLSKTDINDRAKVYSIRKVFWGAWEHLEVILYLLRQAVREGNYDYYHIVTAQDFYSMPIHRIDEIVTQQEGYNFVDYFPIPHMTWHDWELGYGIFQYRTLASYCDVRSGWSWWLNKGVLYLQEKMPWLKKRLPKMDLYGSSVYCTLYCDFVRWLVEGEFPQRFVKRMKNTTCCEEVVIATLIMNSPYKDKCLQTNYRYICWERPNMILIEDDFPKIVNSNCFFCRKVDVRKSGKLNSLLRNYVSNGKSSSM